MSKGWEDPPLPPPKKDAPKETALWHDSTFDVRSQATAKSVAEGATIVLGDISEEEEDEVHYFNIIY